MEVDSVFCYLISDSFKLSERIQLSGIKLSESVGKLKSEVAKHTDVPITDYAVIFHGKCLVDEESLESSGIKHGMTVHVMPSPQRSNVEAAPNTRSEIELEHLALTLKTSMRSSTFRTSFQFFLKPEIFQDIIASTPGLSDDPIAIACLQDVDLLSQFTDVTTLTRAAAKHPALVEGLSHLVANILEPSQAGSSVGGAAAAADNPFSYLMTGSDDEDIPGGSSGTSQTPNDLFGAASGASFITPAQLASALAAVAPSEPPSAAASASDTQLISSELFSQAIQMALNGVAGQQAGGGATPGAAAVINPPAASSLQSQISQLRDMGIVDESLSARVLQMTGGDVQAALELIFDIQQSDRQQH